MEIQNYLYDLLQDFHSLCEENGFSYILYGAAAFDAFTYGELPEMQNRIEVVMPAADFQILQKKVNQENKNRKVESLKNNFKYPYLQAQYVNTQTLLYSKAVAGRIRYPGIYITIRRLIPCPSGKITSKFFFVLHEGLVSALKGNSLLLKKGVVGKGLHKFFRALYILSGRRTAALTYSLTEKLCGHSSYYYIESTSRQRRYIPREFLDSKKSENFGSAVAYMPENTAGYMDFLYPGETQNLIKNTFDYETNAFIFSPHISCIDYVNELSKHLSLNVYFIRKYYLSKGSRQHQKERKILTKAQWQFKRTCSYYHLYDYYSPLLEQLFCWEDQGAWNLIEDYLDEYINVVLEFHKVHLPIGFNKRLYDAVIKYFAFKGDFKNCYAMIAQRASAFEYIDRMEHLTTNKEDTYD